jgi:predicted anti-sigma-YlaC factor YlaD
MLLILTTPAKAISLFLLLSVLLAFVTSTAAVAGISSFPVRSGLHPGSASMNHHAAIRKLFILFLLMVPALASGGCSIKKMAVNKAGDALANSGTTFAADDDPQLVAQALPFGLKLMEGLLAESPKHRGLLFATSSGFTEYAYAFVQLPAENLRESDPATFQSQRLRAKKLYLRARALGFRGLEAKHPGFEAALRKDPKSSMRIASKRDVPLLYWTAVSWGAAISVGKNDPDLVADQPAVEALIDRAYELDRDYDHGAIEQFLISYESARQGAGKDPAVRSRAHFRRAVELSEGKQAGPYVALAETVSVSAQDRAEFESLLKQALAVNSDARPEWRLMNVINKQRAQWMLDHEDDWFAE